MDNVVLVNESSRVVKFDINRGSLMHVRSVLFDRYGLTPMIIERGDEFALVMPDKSTECGYTDLTAGRYIVDIDLDTKEVKRIVRLHDDNVFDWYIQDICPVERQFLFIKQLYNGVVY